MDTTTWKNLTKQVQSTMEDADIDNDTIKDVISKLTSTNKSQRRKKLKDPNAPKRPRSAYIFYCQENRSNLSDMDNKSILKELGKRWKTLTDKEKTPYVKMNEDDKVRYEREMETYTPPEHTEETTTGRRKKTRDPNAPKRPQSAFFLFSSDQRKKLKADPDTKSVPSSELSKRIGELWRNLSDKKKAVYQKKYEANKVKYQHAKEEYESSLQTAAEESPEEEPETEPPKPKPARKRRGGKKK